MSEKTRGPVELSVPRTVAATAFASVALNIWLGATGNLPTSEITLGDGTKTEVLDHALEYGYQPTDPANPLRGGVCVVHETVVQEVIEVPGTTYVLSWPIGLSPVIPVGKRSKLSKANKLGPTPTPDEVSDQLPTPASPAAAEVVLVQVDNAQEFETIDVSAEPIIEATFPATQSLENDTDRVAPFEDDELDALLARARETSHATYVSMLSARGAGRLHRSVGRRERMIIQKLNNSYGISDKTPKRLSRTLPVYGRSRTQSLGDKISGMTESIGDGLYNAAEAIGDMFLDVKDRITDVERRTWALLALSLVGAGAFFEANEYKQSSFDKSNCAFDIAKPQGAIVPDIDLHWDCKIDMSRPDPLPQFGSTDGGQPSRSSTGENPCDDAPITWTKTTTEVDAYGNKLSVETDSDELRYYQAINRWWTAQNQIDRGR